jgi:Domain of unknown function (DUF4126)
VRLFLDITQGMGLAGAAGVRPFLPALLSGALGRADLGLDFEHTRYAFLESNWFLIAVVVLLIVTVVIERRSPGAAESGTFGATLAGVAVGIGALLFAGSLADHGETSWAWLAPGIACALVGQAAARSLFGRVARRLDPEARSALPLYADGGSLATAALAILIPPVSILILGFFGWLWAGGRKRAGEKYAGLRTLTK